jgi:hypothetical protein
VKPTSQEYFTHHRCTQIEAARCRLSTDNHSAAAPGHRNPIINLSNCLQDCARGDYIIEPGAGISQAIFPAAGKLAWFPHCLDKTRQAVRKNQPAAMLC